MPWSTLAVVTVARVALVALVLLASLALAALAAFRAATRRHVRRAHERYPPQGDHIQVDGVRVHYVRRGPGNRPSVVCLHGLNGFLQDFSETSLFGSLDEDVDLVAFDRPGYGHTPRPRAELSDPRTQADWLTDVFDALGLDAPVVVGHSWGGGLAMTLGVRHPERVSGLVLVGPYVYPRSDPNAWYHRLPRMHRLGRFVGRTVVAPGARILGPRYVSASFEPEPVPADYHDLWSHVSLRPGCFETTLEEIRTVDPALATVADRYGEVDVPTVVLTGDEDRSVDPELNARRLVDAMPNARLEVLAGVGHMVLWNHAEHVVGAVREVLQPES